MGEEILAWEEEYQGGRGRGRPRVGGKEEEEEILAAPPSLFPEQWRALFPK